MLSQIVKPLSRDEIRKIVYEIKRKCGLENMMQVPILNFVENVLPQIIPDFQFEVLPIAEMGNKNGETFPKEHRICIREDVYERAANGSSRDRMTIAHELGHLILHENQKLGLCQIDDEKTLAAYFSPEWQANAFAGEFLAASYLIYGKTEEEVMKECNISGTAAKIQLKHACQKHP